MLRVVVFSVTKEKNAVTKEKKATLGRAGHISFLSHESTKGSHERKKAVHGMHSLCMPVHVREPKDGGETGPVWHFDFIRETRTKGLPTIVGRTIQLFSQRII